MILGIDPGVSKTGFALISDNRLFNHRTIIGKEAVTFALSWHTIYKFDRAIIERPQIGILYGRHFDGPNGIKSKAGMIKLAQNIGQNIYLADEIGRELQRIGVMVKMVRPARKCTKWTPEYWQSIFQWKGKKPSEHARDASVIALQYERWAGWKIIEQANRLPYDPKLQKDIEENCESGHHGY